jgi:putative alpha-1,2-mannosidase
MMKLFISSLTLLHLVLCADDAGSYNYNLVDPLIGSQNGGNVFVGASLPYGMAKAVPDTSQQNTGGFAYDLTNITGFTIQHDSGTGGQPSQGMFPLSLQPWCKEDKIENCHWGSKYERAVNYRGGTVKAQPGYFSIGLQDGIDVQTTVTEHAALWNFRFTPNVSTHGNQLSPLMLVDLTDLQDSRQNASVKVDPETGRMSGNGTFLPSFGVGSYMDYFCMDFKGADVRDTGVWVNERAGTEPKELFVNRGYSLFYIEAGGWVRFRKPKNNLLQARVGVSFQSTEQACKNAEEEIGDWNFNRVRKAAEDAWKEKLSVVSIESGGVNTSIQPTELHRPKSAVHQLRVVLRQLLLHLGCLPHNLPIPHNLRSTYNEPANQQLSQHLQADRLAAGLQDATLQRLHARRQQCGQRDRRRLREESDRH